MRVLTRNDLLHRSPEDFLNLNEEILREEYRLTSKAAQTWSANRKSFLRKAQELEARLDHHHIQFITAADAHYPKRIEEMFSNPPAVLYTYGNAPLLERNLFAIMSSRNSSLAALSTIESLTQEAVRKGEILVSGHSTPEYQRAAVVPLRWGAPRVLVLDRGLFKAMGEELSQEPFGAARLWRYEFDPNLDLAISCVNPDRDYYPTSNVTRDELIGALADRIDFIEIKPSGNMQRIAQMALKTEKPIRISTLTPHFEELCSTGAQLIPPRAA
jgi:DNA processing protein